MNLRVITWRTILTPAVLLMAALLGFVLTPQVRAAALADGCRGNQVVCRLTAADQSISARLEEEYFEVSNHTGQTVSLAYGWFERGTDNQQIGEIALPVALPDKWGAQGWFILKPGATQVFYPPGSGAEFYVRVEANGNSIEVADQLGEKEFCVASQSFVSRQQVETEWFVIDYPDRNDTSGESCDTAGGNWQTFYKVASGASLLLE